MSAVDALKKAQELGLDLIEISPNANPPVAKIMDYGKYRYDQKKKDKQAKATGAKPTETKAVQVKMGTGENDLHLKAKKAAEWLAEGHRVQVELFLKGRYKYMEEAFLKTRLEKFLLLIPHAYKIADPIKRGPKGLVCIIERDKSGKAKQATAEQVEAAAKELADAPEE